MHAAYPIVVLVANVVWFSMGFTFFSLRARRAARILIPRSAEGEVSAQALTASLPFPGGFNLACAALSASYLFSRLGGHAAPPFWHVYLASAKNVDTTLVVLREIRDAVKATNGRVDALATEVCTMHRQHLESDIRLATASTNVHATTKDPAALMQETRAAQRIASLEQRMGEVERKVG